MPTDLDAARQRVERVIRGQSVNDVYGLNRHADDAYTEDLEALYRHNHPTDDGEPVTLAWATANLTPQSGFSGIFYEPTRKELRIDFNTAAVLAPISGVWIGAYGLPRRLWPATLRDYRRLLAALRPEGET